MINSEKILEEILEKLSVIPESDIPSIDLYMDQVTTFMDKHLSGNKRYEEDKILTKTMINNYSKNNLLPPPIKKKYSKDHVILLILIYYYKNILSISDINTILTPLCDMYFNSEEDTALGKIYEASCDIQRDMTEHVKSDILEKIKSSTETFMDYPEENRDFLQLYTLITSLCFDVYVKKQMIEHIVDKMNEESVAASAKKSKDKKDKKEKND